jgi:Uma2 family endonuclease
MTMQSTPHKLPQTMTVAEFLDWPGDGTGRTYQLVDGEVRAVSPGSATHGTIQANLARVIGNELAASGTGCRIATEPGVVTRIRSHLNLRVPDLAITRTPDAPGQQALPDPVALIEVLSPGNAADTWDNVWAYTTIPSVREIAVVHSTRVKAEVLRRGSDGHWPAEPQEVGADGELRLESVAVALPLREAYAQTHLA